MRIIDRLIMPVFYLAAIAVVLGAGYGLSYTVSQEKAVNAAQSSGLSDVTVTDTHRFLVGFHGCGKGDVVGFAVTGTNPNGQQVHAQVCAGLFKGATVRY